MYALKPILVDQNIEVPSCMYKLKAMNTDVIGNMKESINNSVSAVLYAKIFRHFNAGIF
jgi:hypothetical protein